MPKRIFLTLALIASLFLAPHYGNASLVIFAADHTFSGSNPSGPTPWLTAIFDDHNSIGSVTLTLSASGLRGNEFVTEWDFNFAPVATLSSLIFTQTQGLTPSIRKGSNQFKADGDGYYDIEFKFPTKKADRFTSGAAIFTITGSGITAQSFKYLSNSPDHPFLSAAHVQGIGNDSVWVSFSQVPIPGSFVLLSSGLLGLVGVRRTFRRDEEQKRSGRKS